jgi:hypothetical protein
MPRDVARVWGIPNGVSPMADGRVDYKREMGPCYRAARTPAFIDVPELAFAMLDGQGDPNTSPAFGAAVEALYGVSYAAKFAVKGVTGLNYAVMPLEGLWWTPGVQSFAAAERSEWRWTLMIMQPTAVTADLFDAAAAQAASRRPSEAVLRVRREVYAEGRAAQILHVGPFATEGPTILELHAFIADHGCAPTGKHHEIYLSDPRRTAPEKLKTILRQPVVSRADGESTDG